MELQCHCSGKRPVSAVAPDWTPRSEGARRAEFASTLPTRQLEPRSLVYSVPAAQSASGRRAPFGRSCQSRRSHSAASSIFWGPFSPRHSIGPTRHRYQQASLISDRDLARSSATTFSIATPDYLAMKRRPPGRPIGSSAGDKTSARQVALLNELDLRLIGVVVVSLRLRDLIQAGAGPTRN